MRDKEEEAKTRCKNAKVLAATQNLADYDTDIIFVPKRARNYDEILEDVKTVFSLYDDFVKQLRLFIGRQEIRKIRQHKIQRIVSLRE